MREYMNLLSSPSKLAFLILTGTACGAFWFGKLESKDFMLLASAAYGYYFAYKGDTNGHVDGIAGK